MKVSELQESDLIRFLRLDDAEEGELQPFLEAAIHYVETTTGLPVSSEDTDCLDNHADITIAVEVLCQDMYDNRSLYVDKTSLNRTVDSILGMYCKNIG